MAAILAPRTTGPPRLSRRAIWPVRTSAFSWFVGAYLLLLGLALLLLAPPSAEPVAMAADGLRGAGTVGSGLALLWVAAAAPGRGTRRAICLAAAALQAAFAAQLGLGGSVPGAGLLGLVAAGLALLAVRAGGRQAEVGPDLLGLLLGGAQAIQGLNYVVRPDSAESPIVALGLHPVATGAILLVGGAAVVGAQIARVPTWAYRAAHAGAGSTIVVMIVAAALLVDPAYWLLGAASFMRGITLATLPWWGERAARIDGRTLRIRLTLTLATVALVPSLVVAPLILAAVDAASAPAVRQATFAGAVVLSVAAGLGGWWLAGRLTGPIAGLAEAVRLIARGRTSALPRVGFTELRHLADDVESMARSVSAHVADVERLAAELRAGEQRFRTLANSVPSIVWTAAPDGTITYASDQWFRYCGITPEENATRWPELVLHPDDRDRCARAWTRALREGTDYEIEVRNRRHDGAYRWFLTRAVPLRDEAGTVTAWFGASTDIHDRKAAELERAWLASAVANSADSVIVRDLAGTILAWSPGAERLFGYTADEALGRSVFELAPPDLLEETADFGARAARGERIEHVETVRVRRDGRHVEVEMSLSPVRDEAGQVVALCAIGRDTTERRRIERALRHQHEVNRTILENATMAVFMMDERQHCTFMNEAAERLIGFALAEVRDRPLHAYVHHTRPDGSPYPLAACPIDRALPERARTQGEETFVHRDGRFYPVAFTASPILADGRPVGTVIEVRDLTEEKRLQRAQHDFIANVSHELRNPLAAVRGFAQLMERRGSYSERAVRAIVDQTGQLERLIGELLEASRLEAGTPDLRRERIDLIAHARACVEEAQATSQQHALRVEAPDRPLEGCWDAGRLSQIFRNLLTNAIKYSPEGGTILVRIEDRGEAADVAVRDHGLGMGTESLERLFDRYYRDDSVAASIKGLGLGLFITRELVEAHGGRIWAESDGPSRGSTFRFTLPYRPPGDASAPPPG